MQLYVRSSPCQSGVRIAPPDTHADVCFISVVYLDHKAALLDLMLSSQVHQLCLCGQASLHPMYRFTKEASSFA